MSNFKGTTIVAVQKGGKTAIAGDGQVTMGETTIMKHGAKKVRPAVQRPGGRGLCRLGGRRVFPVREV